jgi:hypothetical protein
LKTLTRNGVAHRMEHVRSRSDPLDDRTMILVPPPENLKTSSEENGHSTAIQLSSRPDGQAECEPQTKEH